MRKKSFRIFSGMAIALCSAAMLSAAEKNVPMEALDEFELTLDIPEEAVEAPALSDTAEIAEAEEVETKEDAVEEILPPPSLDLPVTDALSAEEAAAPAEDDLAEMEPVEEAEAEELLLLDDVVMEEAAPVEEAEIETILPEADSDSEEILEIAQADTEIVDAEAAPAAEPAPTPIAEAAPVAEPAPTPIAKAAPAAEPAPTPIVKSAPAAEPAPTPIVKAAPVESVVSDQPIPANAVVQAPQVPLAESRGMVAGTVAGNCRNCQNGGGYVVPNPGPGKKAIIYGVQRNGVHAYPRRECPGGNCYGCGPMPYPYYTLRGPRDFDDPNPRPIGP